MDIDKLLDLCTPDNMILAELYEDPQFANIPHDRLGYYLTAVRDIAKRTAARVKVEAAQRSLTELCKERGISVHIVDQSAAFPAACRAEIYYQENIINIFKSSLMEMYQQLQALNFCPGGQAVSIDTILDIHLAHELYHLLEYTEGEDTSALLTPVTSYKFGVFKQKAKIIRASEAAAHLFCMEMLALPFHPKVLDFLCLLQSGTVSAEQVLTFLTDIKKRFNEE